MRVVASRSLPRSSSASRPSPYFERALSLSLLCGGHLLLSRLRSPGGATRLERGAQVLFIIVRCVGRAAFVCGGAV